jgi:hypothetical protein
VLGGRDIAETLVMEEHKTAVYSFELPLEDLAADLSREALDAVAHLPVAPPLHDWVATVMAEARSAA